MGLIHIGLFATLDLVRQSPGGPDEDPAGFPFGGWQAQPAADIRLSLAAARTAGSGDPPHHCRCGGAAVR